MQLTIGGVLDVSFINGFEKSITETDTFAIGTSENTVVGEFDNVATGQRLQTSDGMGSFLVTYAATNNIVLRTFQPVPNLRRGLLFSGTRLLLGFRRYRRDAE